jgi:type I restriction-modification system DNA methylase subunit
MNNDFQTPPNIAKYMANMIPINSRTFLEPTPGKGNLVTAIRQRAEQFSGAMIQITEPDNFFSIKSTKFDCIIMNPPFSLKSAYGVPDNLNLEGMKLGYYIFNQCLKMSDNIIALMTWFVLTDSDVRLRYLKNFGLKSITALPRKTFEYSRIQTCILELDHNYRGETIFRVYDTT